MALAYPIESQHLLVAGAAIVGTFLLWTTLNSPARRAARSGSKLPPGPEQAFLIGNLHNFPKDRFWETFTRWQKEYGDLVYVNLAGKPLIVINSMETALELMDKRMNIYSLRPYKAMVNDVMYTAWSLVVANPGPRFHEQRKVFRKAIGAHAVQEYDGLISHQIGPFLQALYGTPQDIFEIIMRWVSDNSHVKPLIKFLKPAMLAPSS
jgi:cytochrome P450